MSVVRGCKLRAVGCVSAAYKCELRWCLWRAGSEAQQQVQRLAEAFELANVETIAEAPADVASPQHITDHLVGELHRLLSSDA